MAQITIMLDTSKPDDLAMLRAMFGLPQDDVAPRKLVTLTEIDLANFPLRVVEERPTPAPGVQYTQDPPIPAEPQRRTRRTKEQIAADNAAAAQATAPESGSATNGAGPGPDATSDVSLEAINKRLMEMMAERGDGIAQRAIDEIKRITKDAHSGTRNLPPQYWPAVMAALEAL